MSKTIICENCGAAYEDSLRRCPFCGSATTEADENAYIDKLEETRLDLEEYVPKSMDKMKKSVLNTVFIGFIVILVIAVLAVAIVWFDGFRDNRERNKRKEELLKDQGVTVGMPEVEINEM